MPTLHLDLSCLETAREQLSYCRELIVLATTDFRARETAPSVADVHLMCDAVLEYFAALRTYEQACDAEPSEDERADASLVVLQAYRDLRDGTGAR